PISATLRHELAAAGVRVELDARVDVTFGRRAVEWELKGVPVRLELGPRDATAGTVSLVRRDTTAKETVPLAGVAGRVTALLDDIQTALYEQAVARRDANTVDAESLDAARDAAQRGFSRLAWDGSGDAEDRLAEAGMTVRCLQRADGGLPESVDESDLFAVIARADCGAPELYFRRSCGALTGWWSERGR